jgi:predicted nucleic acid-binding Zn ribbon protein
MPTVRDKTTGRFLPNKHYSKCRVCGKKIKSYRKYCSVECRKKGYFGEGNPRWIKDREHRVCPICNKSFRIDRLNQKCCSFKCFKKLFIGRKPYHSKGGKRIDLDGKYFRSIWEANYARYLNYLGMKWEYEPQTFKYPYVRVGPKSYLPDFYLPSVNTFVEIKGWEKPRDVLRMQRFDNYFPGVEVRLINAKTYHNLERMFGDKVPGWEFSNNSISKQIGRAFELKKVQISERTTIK